MKKCAGLLFGLAIVSFNGSSAWAKYPTDICPTVGKVREVFSLKKYRASGGQLIQLVPPNLTNLSRRPGRATFHTIVLTGGVAFIEGADGVTADGTSEVEGRFGSMRYRSPSLAGRPVCVGFDIEWRGEDPQKFEVVPEGMYK